MARAKRIRARWPETHVICGLSNVSFGLPLRKIVNRTFAAMMIACGADALIIDPTDPGMRSTVAASEVLFGMDEYGIGYIGAVREGKVAV